MRKIILCLCLVLTMVFLFSSTAFCVDTERYELGELHMSLEIPEDMIVLTRDMDEDDFGLQFFGITKEDLLNQYESNHIYLEAVNFDPYYAILVTMTTYPGSKDIDDFRHLSEDEYVAVIDSIVQLGSVSGATYGEMEAYQHPDALFLSINFAQEAEGETVYSKQYYTIINGQAINITLHSYDGEVTADMEALVKQVVDSASFEAVEQAAVTGAAADEADDDLDIYADETAGISFTPPLNWSEIDSQVMGEEILKIGYANMNGAGIFFGYQDGYDILNKFEQILCSREDINNDVLTEEMIRESLSLDDNANLQIETEQINDIEYCKIHLLAPSHINGTYLENDLFIHLFLSNGLMYSFYFSGNEDSDAYQDYRSLLESVRYYDVVPTSGYDPYGGYPSSDWQIYGFLLAIVLYALPIVIYRYFIVKGPIAKRKALEITLIYGIVAALVTLGLSFIFQNYLLVTAVLICSFVNYFALTSGKAKVTPVPDRTGMWMDQERDDDQSTETRGSGGTPAQIPDGSKAADESGQALYCTVCGARLAPDSVYCDKCGSRVM